MALFYTAKYVRKLVARKIWILVKLTLALKTIAYYIEIDSSWTDWQRSEIEKAVENALGVKLVVGSVKTDLHTYLKES